MNPMSLNKNGPTWQILAQPKAKVNQALRKIALKPSFGKDPCREVQFVDVNKNPGVRGHVVFALKVQGL